MASKCRWMGTLTGRLVASRKSVHRFRFTILVWVRLTCGGEENNNFEFFYFSPLCGRRRETDSRLLASSTSLNEQTQSFSLYPNVPSYQRVFRSCTAGAAYKTERWGSNNPQLCSSGRKNIIFKFAATCLMRNWTGPRSPVRIICHLYLLCSYPLMESMALRTEQRVSGLFTIIRRALTLVARLRSLLAEFAQIVHLHTARASWNLPHVYCSYLRCSCTLMIVFVFLFVFWTRPRHTC